MHTSFSKTTIAILILLGALGIVWQGVFFVFAVFLLTLLWWLSYNLEIGWYILVFLSPMIHWMLRGVDYWYVFQEYPFFLSIEAPVVEFWALFLLIAFLLSRVRMWSKGESQVLLFPGMKWFALFFLTAVIALANVHSTEVRPLFWYAVRFILFFYIAYIVLGANIVRTKAAFKKSLYALAAGGLFAACIGFVSLFTGAWRDVYGVPRATPFALFRGWAPFGYQHIFLGETLTTTFPVFVYLWYIAKKDYRRWWGSAAIFVLCIGLLTLSRAAWVTFFVEGVLLLLLLAQMHRAKKVYRAVKTALIVLSPVITYFVYFVFTSAIVRGSNAARWALTEVALFFWTQHPLIGNGPGSFIPNLDQVLYFEVEFGAAIDAHGIAQKLLAEQGILGLLTFSLFIGWILWRLYMRYRNEKFSHTARLVGFFSLFLVVSPLVFQIFNTQYYSPKMWVPIAIAIIGSIVHKRDKIGGVIQINFKKEKVDIQEI